MAQRKCLILGLLLLFLPGCPVLARLLPWNVAEGSLQTGWKDSRSATASQSKAKDIDEDDDPEHHACCESPDTVMRVRCDSNGREDMNGDHMCCAVCHKVCWKRPPEMDGSKCPGESRHCYDLIGDPSNGYKCKHCGESCVLSPDAKPKPPVPVPVPDCSPERHCTAKETCKVIGGDCCATCHQGCFPLSGE